MGVRPDLHESSAEAGALESPGRVVVGATPEVRGDDQLAPLSQVYALIIHVPYYVDEYGEVWMEPLWHRDVMEHLTYIKRLLLVAPRLPKGDRPGLIRLQPPPGAELEFEQLPHYQSMAEALLKIPRLLLVMWRATSKAQIVHSGIVGWPFPAGWIANPLALVRGRKLVLVIESATWRLTGSRDDNWRRHVRAVAYERLGRWFVEHADLSFFTQPSYRDALFVRGRGRAEITPASWINHEDIAPLATAVESWDRKLAWPRARLLFAGRLTSDKGVEVLLDAVKRLDATRASVEIDLIGEGPLAEAATQLARTLQHTRLNVLQMVPYGAPFFDLLRDYEAVLIPSLSDEQPRIVFDAYSQGVPVIATSTAGLVPHVIEGKTGRLVAKGDADAFATAVRRAIEDRSQLRSMGLAALAEATEYTHRAMHRKRWRAILETFGSAP